jgi:hypothetical protein
MAFRPDGTLDPKVYVSPGRNWGGETAFRRQVHYVITDRLEPSLHAAGSALEHSLKAQAYIRGIENFPDFVEVWSQHFRDIPCAITPVPAKDYGNTESMIEINLIALNRLAYPAVKLPIAADLADLSTIRGRPAVVGSASRRSKMTQSGPHAKRRVESTKRTTPLQAGLFDYCVSACNPPSTCFMSSDRVRTACGCP